MDGLTSRPVWNLLGYDDVKTGSEMPVLRQSRPPNFYSPG